MQEWLKMEHVVDSMEHLDKRLRGEGPTLAEEYKEEEKERARWKTLSEEEKEEEQEKDYEEWKQNNERASCFEPLHCYCPDCLVQCQEEKKKEEKKKEKP